MKTQAEHKDFIVIADSAFPYLGRTEYRIIREIHGDTVIQKELKKGEGWFNVCCISDSDMEKLINHHKLFVSGRDQSAAIYDFLNSR